MDYYYYFYDWDVQADKECKGTRIPVNAFIDIDPDCVPILGVGDEVQEENSIQIFPNPVSNQFKINLDLVNEQRVNIELYDINGKLVKTIGNGAAISGVQTITVDVSELVKGLYVIRISGSDFNHTERLVLSN